MNDRIFLETERLIRRYGTRDPFELLDSLNVVVKFSTAFSRDGLKGFCTIMNRTRYVVINASLRSEEQRVVAGHEAGHIVVHADNLKIGTFRDNDIYLATGKMEREANIFAADFLISDDEVMEHMRSCDANFFNVARALCIPPPFFAFKLYSMVERGYAMRMPVDLNSSFLANKNFNFITNQQN